MKNGSRLNMVSSIREKKSATYKRNKHFWVMKIERKKKYCVFIALYGALSICLPIMLSSYIYNYNQQHTFSKMPSREMTPIPSGRVLWIRTNFICICIDHTTMAPEHPFFNPFKMESSIKGSHQKQLFNCAILMNKKHTHVLEGWGAKEEHIKLHKKWWSYHIEYTLS